MKSKLAAILTLSILAFPVYAQQPQLTSQQAEFQKRYDALQDKYNLNYRALEHLAEFQDLQKAQQGLTELSKEVQAASLAAQKAVAPVQPTQPTPVKK